MPQNMENELPKRKPTRLKEFDYNSEGAYFLTICVEHRKNIFGSIVGEGSPHPQLSRYGEIVDRFIQEIPKKYQEISADYYVIMPNHIHLLLSVIKEDGRGDPFPTVDSAIGWFKYQATKEINKTRGMVGKRVFQRFFYDHIIRNRQDYEEHMQYICENPMRWYYDELYTEE